MTVSDFKKVKKNNVSQMKAALAKGPLSVSLDAESRAFDTYKKGVFNHKNCGHELDHAVLAVGFGKDADSGLEYWVIKNSYGTSWGEDGFMRLSITEGKGTCGVQMEPLLPISN